MGIHNALKIISTLGVISLCTQAYGQYAVGTGKAREIYVANCASCHGQNGEGGTGGALINNQWKYGGTDADLTRAIKDGFPDGGMEAYKDTLTDEEIRALVIFIREQSQIAERENLLKRTTPQEGVFSSEKHAFTLEKVAEGGGILWGIDFLPDDSILVTQKDGVLWHFSLGFSRKISGIPQVWDFGQGGLMEVAVHPDYEQNGWIYLGYSESMEVGGRDVGQTTVVRGRIDDGKWVDEERIWRAPDEFYLPTRHHFGTRFVFQEGHLFFAIGDRGRRNEAQDLSHPYAKVHRIFDDGRIPDDNPFLDVAGAYPTTWSYGHRNIQGMDQDPRNGNIWAVEHGPRGGDELNWIEPGKNYGWAEITYGMNYNGSPITEKTDAPGMEQPELYWVPSIAICGASFYRGDAFPRWKNNYFIAGMATEQLHRITIEGETVVSDEIVMKNQGRVRDVTTGPDGMLYVLLNSGDPRVGSVYRLVPAGDTLAKK